MYREEERGWERKEGGTTDAVGFLSILMYLGDISCPRKTEIPVKTRQELPRSWEAGV